MDPFRSHLVNLLYLYQAGLPPAVPLPTYDGPSDESTDTIFRLLGNLTKRLHDAELKNVAFPLIYNGPLAPSLAPAAQGDLPGQPLETDGIRSFSPASTTRRSISLRGNDTPLTQASMVSNLAFLTAPYFPASPPPDPLPMPMNPLAATAFESGASVLEEMRMLKSQVGDIARVCSAVTRGDLSQKVTTPVQGVVMSQLKDVINNMVDKLGQFSKEVARVSQEVDSDSSGVSVPSFEGTWRDLAGVVAKLAAKHTGKT